MRAVLLLLLALVHFPANAEARTLCSVVADAASGAILLEEGECRERVTPASTFKIALAVMGFDARILTDPGSPALPFREGYPDWGGKAWRQPTDPAHWMKHSVVWYSQEIAKLLGKDALTRYARDLGYGNADLSGDPGRDNGLERAWIGSSLRISPVEQTIFLAGLVNGTLPVAPRALAMTKRIVESGSAGGWTVHGKTGSAFPRKADGTLDRSRGWGWFVGWAKKDGRTLAFARLAQDEKREKRPGGLRAREAFLAEWPAMAARLSR